MALSTRAELITAVGQFIDRTDAASVAATCVALAEARMNRELRVSQMLTLESIAASSDTATVPDDFLAPVTLRMVGSPYYSLKFLTPEQMAAFQADLPAGTTAYWTLRNDTIWLCPEPDTATTLELLYYAKIPSLTEDDDTNWVLANFPDAYLYGAAAEAAQYYADDNLSDRYAIRFQAALEGIRSASRMDAMPQGLNPSPSGFVV